MKAFVSTVFEDAPMPRALWFPAPAFRGSLPVFVAILFLSGCGSGPKMPPPLARPGPGPMSATERHLWEGVRDWQGVPYRWGGNGRGGVDCSGLAVAVYRDLYGIGLPRTTRDQVRVGRTVPFHDLRPADLVFFRDRNGGRHVGIYLRNRMFIHASKSRGGVVVSRLDTPHWREMFWTAKRVPG
jgi:probable lipoprotein NlpC